MVIEEIATDRGYDLWAPIYEEDGNPMMGLDQIVVYQELTDILAGKKTIDLGCGTGRHSLWISQQAESVTALDFSEGMLERAKNKPGAEKISFIKHDLSQTLPFEDNSFELVLSSLVLEHIYDLKLFFQEAERICTPGGILFITAMHPAMMLKGTQANFSDPQTGKEIRPKGYPNQMSDFIMAIQSTDLVLEKMQEYFGSEELVKMYPRGRKYLNWPMLVSFRLRKN